MDKNEVTVQEGTGNCSLCGKMSQDLWWHYKTEHPERVPDLGELHKKEVDDFNRVLNHLSDPPTTTVGTLAQGQTRYDRLPYPVPIVDQPPQFDPAIFGLTGDPAVTGHAWVENGQVVVTNPDRRIDADRQRIRAWGFQIPDAILNNWGREGMPTNHTWWAAVFNAASQSRRADFDWPPANMARGECMIWLNRDGTITIWICDQNRNMTATVQDFDGAAAAIINDQLAAGGRIVSFWRTPAGNFDRPWTHPPIMTPGSTLVYMNPNGTVAHWRHHADGRYTVRVETHQIPFLELTDRLTQEGVQFTDWTDTRTVLRNLQTQERQADWAMEHMIGEANANIRRFTRDNVPEYERLIREIGPPPPTPPAPPEPRPIPSLVANDPVPTEPPT